MDLAPLDNGETQLETVRIPSRIIQQKVRFLACFRRCIADPPLSLSLVGYMLAVKTL